MMVVVHCWHGRRVVQQPLIRRGAAAAADGAGPSAEGNPRVRGGVLVSVRLTPALLLGVVLMIVVMVVVCSEEHLLVLTQPGDPSVRRLLAQRLLSDNSRAVDVIVLHMRRLYLVYGVDGDGMLKTTVGHSTVQQGLGYDGGGHAGYVVGNPGLHVLAGASDVLTLKWHLAQLQK